MNHKIPSNSISSIHPDITSNKKKEPSKGTLRKMIQLLLTVYTLLYFPKGACYVNYSLLEIIFTFNSLCAIKSSLVI